MHNGFMKNIYTILALFFGLQTSAQKTVYIYNFSSTNFDIGNIGTQHETNTYPMFVSNYSGPLITIPSNTIDSLYASPASTTKFPFYSTSSTIPIDYWLRQLTYGGTYSNLPSNLVATIYGNTQILEHVKTQVGPRGSLGGGTLFPTQGNNYSVYYTFGS